MRKFLVLLTLSIWMPIISAQANQTWVNQLIKETKQLQKIKKAAKLVQKNKSRAAYQLLQQTYAQNKEIPPPEFLLGIIYMELKKGKAAHNILEQAGDKHPTYPGVYILLGNLSLVQGRNVEARLLYQEAYELANRGDWKEYQRQAFLDQIYTGRAALAERKQDWEKMADYFEKLLKIKGKAPALRQRMAICHFRAGKKSDVYENLQQAHQENSNLELPEFTMAKLYDEQGDMDKAKEWLKKALYADPKDPNLRYRVAKWLLENAGSTKAAQTQAQKAKELGFKGNAVDILLGIIAREEKKYQEAEEIFEKIYQENPSHFTASNQLALSLIEQDDKSKQRKALKLAKINAKLLPRNVSALTTLGWIYFKLGQVNAAEKILAQALKVGGNPTAETAYYLAHVTFKQERLEQTKRWLKVANQAKGHFIYKEEVKKWLDQLGNSPE